MRTLNTSFTPPSTLLQRPVERPLRLWDAAPLVLNIEVFSVISLTTYKCTTHCTLTSSPFATVSRIRCCPIHGSSSLESATTRCALVGRSNGESSSEESNGASSSEESNSQGLGSGLRLAAAGLAAAVLAPFVSSPLACWAQVGTLCLTARRRSLLPLTRSDRHSTRRRRYYHLLQLALF